VRALPRAAWAVLAAALALRLAAAACYFRVPLSEGGDDRQYAAIAESVADGRGFQWKGAPSAYRAPLYPLFLAALRRLGAAAPGDARLVQAFVGGAAVWLAYQLGAAAAGPAAGLAAMALTAFDPAQVLLPTSLYTECVFGVLVLLAAWALARYRELPSASRAAAFGAAVGLSALCRSTLLLAPALLLLGAPGAGRGLRHALAAAAVALAVLSPWALRNALTFGRPILSESGVAGPVLYYASEGRVYAPPREDSVEPMRTMYRSLPPAEWDAFALRSAAANVRARPARYGASVVRRAWRLWADPYLPYLLHDHPALSGALETGRDWDALSAACQGAFLVVALLAALAAAGPARPAVWAALALALYSGVYALAAVFARFHAPFIPLVYVAAAAGWADRRRRVAVTPP